MNDTPSAGAPITIWTYDWVPAREGGPRGFVRDLRLRWAMEEAGLAYQVRTVPLGARTAEHMERHPFGQVPFMEDGEIRMFESGACLLHLAKKSDALMPRDARGEAETVQWVFAALNSIEMVSVPWWFTKSSGDEHVGLAGWLRKRLDQLEAVLSEREWLAAGRFTIADIVMTDALRIPDVRAFAESEILHAYIERACARPAFQKAFSDQMEHFAAADALRAEAQ